MASLILWTLGTQAEKMSAAGIDLGQVVETVADFWDGESLTDFLTKLRQMQDEEKRRVEAEERAIRAEREGARLRQALTQVIEDLPSQMQEKVSDFAIHRVIHSVVLVKSLSGGDQRGRRRIVCTDCGRNHFSRAGGAALWVCDLLPLARRGDGEINGGDSKRDEPENVSKVWETVNVVQHSFIGNAIIRVFSTNCSELQGLCKWFATDLK
ncbi:MAG: DUF1631 domain-containing protein [Thaumarchaeota archaeon]|nr:DUF1631 domain-containing protein [Nitrososphaerota archaeon]